MHPPPTPPTSPVAATPTLRRRVTHGAAWSVCGAAANRALYLLASIAAARLLGKHGYGQFSFIQSTAGMIALFAGFGLGTATTKQVARFRSADPPRAGRVIGLSGLCTLLTGAAAALFILISAPWLAHHTLFEPGLVEMFRVSALVVFCGAITGAQIGILNGLESFPVAAFLTALSGVAMLLGLVGGIHCAGVPGALWGLGGGGLFCALLNLALIRREAARFGIPVSLRGARSELPMIWNYGLPTLLAAGLVMPVYWLGLVVLARHFGFGAQAEYNIAAQWRTAASWLPVMLTTAYLPVLSSLLSHQQHAGRRLLKSGLLLSGSIALLAALAIALGAHLLLRLYGPAYTSAAWVVRILAFAAVFDSANELISQGLLAGGRAWLRLQANAAWAVITSAGILLFVPRTGALGLALVLSVTQALHLLLQLSLYSRFLCMPEPSTDRSLRPNLPRRSLGA